MEHLVPADVADTLRAAGLRPVGPFVGRERRARWAALDGQGDRWVVTEVEPRAAGAARARARALAGVRHSALAPAARVIDLPEGGVLTVGAAPPGTDLGTVLAARGVLEDDEVVGLLAPVAEGLAAMHAVGVPHGGPGDADVVLTDAGPVLVDGAGRTRTGAAPATREADVAALAALGLRALGVEGPGTGTRSRVAALCADPPPDAAGLAAALRDAAPAALPVLPAPEVLASLALRRLAGGRAEAGPGPERARHRAPRPVGRRIGLAAACVVAALGVAGAVHGPPGGAGGPARDEDTRVEALRTDAPRTEVVGERGPGLPPTWQSDAREAAARLTLARVEAQVARSGPDLLALSETGSPAALLDAEAVRSWPAAATGGAAELAAPDDLQVLVGVPTLLGCTPGLVCVPVRFAARYADDAPSSAAVTLALRPGSWLVVSVSGR